MRASEYIIAKQVQWAMNQDIKLTGSEGKRGRPAYTPSLDENLFEPLLPDVRESFEKGDGNEVNGSKSTPAKMQAVHSSSALGVNIFQYWQRIDHAPSIAAACGFCRKGNKVSRRIVFEGKYAIDDRFQFSPNIDVVFHNSDSAKYKRFAVECKFSEAYGSQGHGGMKPAYLELDGIWDEIPAIGELAQSICPHDDLFTHLHSAQLIKHILGLKRAFGKSGFRLLYLWYDVLGEEGAIHRKEIETFTETAKSDGVKFHALSYQELIVRLSNEYRQDHGEYVTYMTERYL